MSSKLKLTLACGDYEIIRALKDGTITPDGIELTVLTDMDSSSRHWQMIRNQEFDVCELSCSSYLMAKDRGQEFSAIPIFLHRQFRHGFIFVNNSKGIKIPNDLDGKRVGLKTYQPTAILYLRGLLASEYNVDLTSIDWVTEFEEEIPFETPTDIRLSRAPKGSAIPVPTSNVKLNKYGNLPGGQSRIKRLLKRSRVFQGTINGLAGIWLRPKRGRQRAGTYGVKGKQTGLQLLVAYEPKTSYQPRYDFYGIGQRSVKSNITGEMNKAITKTLASAM